ncbi:hypothetical protein EON66_04490, partial [archaeon]
MFWLGYSHHVGDAEAGIRCDADKAARYLQLAASQGHPGAQHYLSRCFRTGDVGLGVRMNAARADYFLQLAVEAGHPEALYEAADVALHDLESDTPSLTYEKDGASHFIEAEFIAGCDGFHGPSRKAIPAHRAR